MPSSDHSNISLVMDLVLSRRGKIRSILDLGIGCGKYAFLFREYLDGHWTGSAFHDRQSWKITIHGVEVFAPYIVPPVHNYIYNEIFNMEITHFIAEHVKTNKYDLIMLGDVIEHFCKADGIMILKALKGMLHHNGMILISTPNFLTRMGDNALAPFGNLHERHQCQWSEQDFKSLPDYIVEVFTGKLLTVVLR